MIQFFKENPACDIFLILGLSAWLITLGAYRTSKKTGHYVSGLPALGGIFIIIGFLTSSKKLLAVLGLLDPALLYLIIKGIPDIIRISWEDRNWVPPEEFDGRKVVAFSSYNKCYAEIPMQLEGQNVYQTHRITRYLIVRSDNGYELLGTAYKALIVTRKERSTLEECRKAAAKNARWQMRE
ncbi:MAG: hypothetical protein IKI58_00640 [Oscillospiraceae bacterium]|nr:hypothetical protein [Oscillospiraceae bacterium]